MGDKVTLGGDRLGSGAKNEIELKQYSKSTHDLGYVWRSSMAAGTLVPFLSELALPGDSFDINLSCDVMTHPTVGPLFGSYKVQLDVFSVPIRLYNADLHNNELGIGMDMSQVYLPQIKLLAAPPNDSTDYDDLANWQINPSCILSYLNIRGIGFTKNEPVLRTFNAVPFLGYWDIYKNYYANKSEKKGAFIHTPLQFIPHNVTQVKVNNTALPASVAVSAAPVVTSVAVTSSAEIDPRFVTLISAAGEFKLSEYGTPRTAYSGGVQTFTVLLPFATTITNWRYTTNQEIQVNEIAIGTFDLSNLDELRRWLLNQTSKLMPVEINNFGESPLVELLTWDTTDQDNILTAYKATQEGLALKTYQSDLFNNWLDTERMDAITARTTIDTTAGGFSIDQLNLTQKVYELLNQVAASGGSYDDWLNAVYNAKRIRSAETPIYCGGLIKELIFQEISSTAAAPTNDGTQPLGQLAGKGKLSEKHKGGKINITVDEPSYIMGIISLTPRIDYSQGNKWDVHLQTMDDFHKPALDQIGYQDLLTEQMAWFSTEYIDMQGSWLTKSAGKQPAWINYMTNVNKVLGNFAIKNNEMFMTLNRDYEFDKLNNDIKDLTTYIDPSKFNHIFAETALDAQNFWTQIGVNMNVRRRMSAKQIPSL